MADRFLLLDGSTFFLTNGSGDSQGGPACAGYFNADVRHLSVWELLWDGAPVEPLSSDLVAPNAARVVGRKKDSNDVSIPVVLTRSRFVADGVHEDLQLQNLTAETQFVKLRLRYECDFADIFEVMMPVKKKGDTRIETGDDEVKLLYAREDFTRATTIRFTAPAKVSRDHTDFDIRLEPRGKWSTCVEISTTVDGYERAARGGHDALGDTSGLDAWLESAPEMIGGTDPLRRAYRQARTDLYGLRYETDGEWVPAGGAPWFMALFGRDSLVAAFAALPFYPELALATLKALAGRQAVQADDFTDAEPGKILHELRRGELVSCGDKPHSPYYGSHDSTLLFLILLDEYHRWTKDDELIRKLEPEARMAIQWSRTHADLDGDGFLEYQTRSSDGLKHHGWKDSDTAVQFADGADAPGPIALCEVQGYAYDAWVRSARLAREVWLDDEFAGTLEKGSAELQSSFADAYLLPDGRYFALALDGLKRKADAITSNPGHLLWSGILSADQAAIVVERLLEPDMWTGWGIRTMSSRAGGYSPMLYHNGCVWPHDNALIAEGLRRYGYLAEAAKVAEGILDAADAFSGQLPEVFGGFDRAETDFPVEYPNALRPQAWAAGATLLLMRTLLGLDVSDGKLKSVACPSEMEFSLNGVCVHGVRVS